MMVNEIDGDFLLFEILSNRERNDDDSLNMIDDVVHQHFFCRRNLFMTRTICGKILDPSVTYRVCLKERCHISYRPEEAVVDGMLDCVVEERHIIFVHCNFSLNSLARWFVQGSPTLHDMPVEESAKSYQYGLADVGKDIDVDIEEFQKIARNDLDQS
jgi:hypothetical protein